SLFQGKWRKYGGYTFCKHSLARPGRTNKNNVMRPGCGYLKCPLNILLSFDIRKVELVIIDMCIEFSTCINYGLLQRFIAIQKVNNLFYVIGTIYLQLINNCCFSGILFWKNKTIESFLPCINCNWQNPFNRLKGAIKRQF